MSTPNLASISADPRWVKAEPSDGGSVVCLDFQSVAGLIDAVAGSEPVRLETLLREQQQRRWRYGSFPEGIAISRFNSSRSHCESTKRGSR